MIINITLEVIEKPLVILNATEWFLSHDNHVLHVKNKTEHAVFPLSKIISFTVTE